MRQLVYSVALSLDGYIAGPQGEYDWIPMDPDIDFATIGARFDTLLMGRRTYQPMAAAGSGGGGPFSGMKILVASRTLRQAEHPGATIVAELTADFLETEKRKPGKDIWLFGGGRLFREILTLGQIDAVDVAVVPVVLGGGVPFVATPGPRAGLVLRGHKVYPKSGIVSLEYDVKRAKAR